MDHEIDDQPVLTAGKMVEWKIRRGLLPRLRPPRGVALCFEPSVIRYARRSYRLEKVDREGQLYALSAVGGNLIVAASRGVGAPAAVTLLEELAALGARRLVAIGLAGALQPTLDPGALVLVERALRDEGTSRHYLPAGRWASANPMLLSALARALNDRALSYHIGGSWTTDAPYRELRSQVEQYRQEGVLTVEMEAAALFAAGECLGVQVASALVAADTLGGQDSPLEFEPSRTRHGLEVLFDAAIRILTEVG